MSLWSWGANSYGQLGHGISSEEIKNPQEILGDYGWDTVKQIACGGGHTILLDNEGKLFSCGWNHRFQLGEENASKVFRRIWSLSGINFVKITCGWDFSCGITNDEFLIVWGSNSNGQLGLPRSYFSQKTQMARLQIKATEVSMGLRHTALINKLGEVWVTGCGKHGQLGLGTEILSSDRFLKVNNLDTISHLSCGQNHTIAWSARSKALYVWGDNKYSQLLLSSEKYRNIYTPQKIDIDLKENIIKLLSGWTNVLLLLEDGTLRTWGRNNYGQLGTKEPLEGKICKVSIPGDIKIKDVALGSEHTICLGFDNSLWAWGWNEHCNTGTDLKENIFTPTRININIPLEITQIYAGSAHNFIVSKEMKYKSKTEMCSEDIN